MDKFDDNFENYPLVSRYNWFKIPICKNFVKNRCELSDQVCTNAHYPPSILVDYCNETVSCCYNYLMKYCNRRFPCKYFHPPEHIKQEVLRRGVICEVIVPDTLYYDNDYDKDNNKDNEINVIYDDEMGSANTVNSGNIINNISIVNTVNVASSVREYNVGDIGSSVNQVNPEFTQWVPVICFYQN